MNNKTLISLILTISMSLTAGAGGIKTLGDGSIYNFERLSQMEGSGIQKLIDEGNGKVTYILSANDTIAVGDKFQLDEGTTVRFEAGVTFVVEGEANFSSTATAYFESAFDCETLNANIRIAGQAGTTVQFANCMFNMVGVESVSAGALAFSDCCFLGHDGSNAAAIYFITAGEKSIIQNCYFEECRKAAIGSSANASQAMTISECTLVKNSRNNGNIPQINITAAEIEIQNCQIEGDPENHDANNMVGGIGISNFMSYSSNILISGCFISENRYGIGTVGPVRITIEGNQLLNNDHEANPMNGGSGISIYDPYKQTLALISRNRIEGNLWGVTVIGGKDVRLGKPQASDYPCEGMNVFRNNGNNGQLYDLYNNSANTVYAQNNIWGVDEQTQELIETVIFHKADDAKLGEVVYWPAATTTGISLPSVDCQQGREVNLGGIATEGSKRSGIVITQGRKILR